MAGSEPIPDNPNTYVLDPESATEMARLLLQDRIITQSTGGLFPERDNNLDGITKILDIGCGPGGWPLDVALTYPHIDVTGIDISKMMIAYADSQAKRHDLGNMHFRVMNALETLDFEDNYFDLVNIRAAVGYIPREIWPKVLQECKRITNPGGILRLGEGDHIGNTSSAAFERFQRWVALLIHRIGYGFSPDGYTLGITQALGPLLRKAGYGQIGYRVSFLDFSHGTPIHASHAQNISVIFKSIQNPLIQAKITTREEIDETYHQTMQDLSAEDFQGFAYSLTAWGTKQI